MPSNRQLPHWPACKPVCKRCDLCTQPCHITSLQQQQQQQQTFQQVVPAAAVSGVMSVCIPLQPTQTKVC
jgi:hypothetical protein